MRGHYESESWEQGRRILNSQQFKQIGAIGHCPNQEPFGSRSAQAVGRDARSRSTVSTIRRLLVRPRTGGTRIRFSADSNPSLSARPLVSAIYST